MTAKPILIVEDNEKNMKLVRDVLQVKGYQTLEAATAEDGIALAQAHSPDLVLMDIQLPGMNGIEALGVLRENPATAHIPVIAVTASVMQQDRKLITEAGFDAYIGKPINLKEFLATVCKSLRDVDTHAWTASVASGASASPARTTTARPTEILTAHSGPPIGPNRHVRPHPNGTH